MSDGVIVVTAIWVSCTRLHLPPSKKQNKLLPATEHVQVSRSAYKAIPAKSLFRPTVSRCLKLVRTRNVEDRRVLAASLPVPPRYCREHPTTQS